MRNSFAGVSSIGRRKRERRRQENLAREAEQRAEQQAAQQREAARIHRDNELAQIKIVVDAFRAEIEAWYHTELAAATELYANNHAEYQTARNGLSESQEKIKAELMEEFNIQHQNLITTSDYSDDAEFLLQCQQIINQFNINSQASSQFDLDNTDLQYLFVLTYEFEQKLLALNDVYEEVLQQLEEQWQSYEDDYNNYLLSLNPSREEQLSKLDAYELEEIEKVEAEYQAHLVAINQELRARLDEINRTLAAQLKYLKHAALGFIVTALTVALGAAATYYSAGLLSGFSAYLMQMVRTTLALTSLRATERLVNGNNSIGIDVSINVAPQPKPSRFNTVTQDKKIDQYQYNEFDTEAFQRRFEEFGQSVVVYDASQDVIVGVGGSDNPRQHQTHKPNINHNSTSKAKDLEESFGNSLLIGSGRALVETGQGIKQLTMQCGEKLGFVAPEAVANYTQAIKNERDLYHRTPVANSVAGKVGGFGTEVVMYSVLPVGAGLNGYRLVRAGAASGGLISGLAPVYDGLLETRCKNAAFGVAAGAVVTPVVGALYGTAGKGVAWLYDARKGGAAWGARASSKLDWKYAQGNGISESKRLLFSKAINLDFAPTGYLDGQLYPVDKLRLLGNYLHLRGVDVNITKGNPGFQARNPITGKPALYFTENPTVLEIKHELSHWLDYKSLGIEKYSQLSRLEKEQMVLERLNLNRVWESLNDQEKAFSFGYIEIIKDEIMLKNKDGFRNAK